MTPEGRIKKQVKVLLEAKGLVRAGEAFKSSSTGWYYMPVQGTIGSGGIPDFIGHWKGKFFAIETKAEKGVLTVRQEINLASIRATGGWGLLVKGNQGVQEFSDWIRQNWV